jgi:monoamine oxidase
MAMNDTISAGLHKSDVVVVGAGFSGLAAALRLRAAGFTVSVLEARERVGGRVKAGQIAGITVDLGGMWVAPEKHARLTSLALHYGTETYSTHLEGFNLTTLGDRQVKCQGEDFSAAMSPAGQQNLGDMLACIDALSSNLKPESPWDKADAKSLDACSVSDWLDLNCTEPDARAAFNTVVRSVMCAEPQQISLLFFMTYLKGGGGFETLTSAAPGGAQSSLYHGGMHQISAEMAAELEGHVHLGQPVTAIRQKNGSVDIITKSGCFVAKRAIIALSPTMAANIEFSPTLPPLRATLTQNMKMGSVIKVWVAYDTPFWRERGLNGFLLSDEDSFNVCFDVTPPGQPLGLIAGFFDASEAVHWSKRSEAERREEVLRTLAKALGDRALAPLDYIENDWTGEQWSGGCYGAYAPPGVLAANGSALREPVGRLHWAGTEASTRWSGYIEGAILSGERAADEVAALL